MSRKFKIAYVPFFPVLGDTEKNFEKIRGVIEKYSPSADLIFFPELSTSGYLLENLTFSSALEIPRDLPGFLLNASHKTEIHLGLPLVENGMIYNAHVVLLDGKIALIHKKIYLPTYGFFDEGRYFTAGSSLPVYDGKLGKSAVLICEDAFHPALAYSLYESGVKHLFVPSCSPARGINQEGFTSSYAAWKKRLEVYAESFGMFCYYQNRFGSEDGVFFDGRSLFVSPNMNTLEGPQEPEEEIFLMDIDLQDLSAAYQRGGPFHDENFELNHKLFLKAKEYNSGTET